MDIQNKHVLLTGAAGGIGQLLAKALHAKGAQLVLVDHNEAQLVALSKQLDGVHIVVGDLATTEGCANIVEKARQALGQIDVLINLAGVMSFACYENEEPAMIDLIVRVNLLGAMHLTRLLLPEMVERNQGGIINVGSVFGTIGFAYFSSYSASKFGLRGFSEGLRRELAETAIKVMYIAPRAVKTSLNSNRILRMGEATGMNMDEPAWVVEQIMRNIDRSCKEAYIGFPESFFARLNACFPRLVDKALAAQNKVARKFAKES